MSFQTESSTLTTFRARPLVSATIPRKNALQITPAARAPRFPVSGEREKSSGKEILTSLVVSYELEIATGASIALCAIATSSIGLLKPRIRHATI